jgi:AbrB family looped-hinge helix DNA binding protein
MSIVKVCSRGRVALPKELRVSLNIREGDALQVLRDGDGLRLRRTAAAPASLGWRAWRGVLAGSDALAQHLRGHEREASR